MRAAADQRCLGMYRNLVLLLRSLQACSLGVVLAKVARFFYTYRGTADLRQLFTYLPTNRKRNPCLPVLTMYMYFQRL